VAFAADFVKQDITCNIAMPYQSGEPLSTA